MTKNKLAAILSKQANSGSFSHAYLVYGKVNIEEVRVLLKISHADFFQIIEVPIKINQVRELIHWVSIKPHSSRMKLVYLQEVEKMTLDAGNSLLKILEEPPANNIFILQSFKKEKLLPTITSRCQIIRENHIVSRDEDLEKYKTIAELSKLSFKGRFDYASELVSLEDKEKIVKIINLWEQDFRGNLIKGKDERKILEKLNKTKSLLLSNTSVKLLLENLVMEF